MSDIYTFPHRLVYQAASQGSGRQSNHVHRSLTLVGDDMLRQCTVPGWVANYDSDRNPSFSGGIRAIIKGGLGLG